MKTRHILSTAIATLGLSFLTTAGAADITDQDITEGYRKHAAMAQFHRWYQVYERPDGGLNNALDILARDVSVKSGLGEAVGLGQYAARVMQLPDTWRNAHSLKDADIAVAGDGTMRLTADITYLNEGMNPDGTVREADLSYTMTLVPTDTVLPRFRTIEIAQNSDGEAGAFVDAYAENRMRSLVHYWLALIEDPARDPEPVREILAEDFSLNFTSGALTDFEGFRAWLAGPGSQVSASTHGIGNFSARETGNGTYALTVDFDWAGVTPDGTNLVAKTRHNWTATNDPTERFARIRTMDVEVLEPFRPRE